MHPIRATHLNRNRSTCKADLSSHLGCSRLSQCCFLTCKLWACPRSIQVYRYSLQEATEQPKGKDLQRTLHPSRAHQTQSNLEVRRCRVSVLNYTHFIHHIIPHAVAIIHHIIHAEYTISYCIISMSKCTYTHMPACHQSAVPSSQQGRTCAAMQVRGSVPTEPGSC